MKIGMLTLHPPFNYGNALQLLSLHCYLREQGYDADVWSLSPSLDDRLWADADSDRSVVMECFIDPKDEYESWRRMSSVATYDPPASLRSTVGRLLPSGLKNAIKSAIHAS